MQLIAGKLDKSDAAGASAAEEFARDYKPVSNRTRLKFSDYLPYLINRVGWLLVTDFGQNTLARHQLSIPTWRVLAALAEHDGQRQIDLAGTTSIDVSTLSRVITRMVKMALVTRTRSATNNREVTVCLTPNGAAVLARVIPHAIELEAKTISGVSVKDLNVVRRSLRQMYQNLAAPGRISRTTGAPPLRKSAASAVSAPRRQQGRRTPR
jgi:DNA-binding MarR family transcriptional regulator